MMDLGIYAVQSCRYVLGEEPVSVTAQFGPKFNKRRFAQVEETVYFQMEFPSGTVSNCQTSYAFNTDRFYASADEGFFELSPAISYGPFKGRSSKGEILFPVINQQAAQLDGIGQLILEKKQLPSHITGEEGIKDIRIIRAILEAGETGKKVSLG
jgi:predicted dehydrogenase